MPLRDEVARAARSRGHLYSTASSRRGRSNLYGRSILKENNNPRKTILTYFMLAGRPSKFCRYAEEVSELLGVIFSV